MNSPRFLSPVTEPTRRGQPRERLVANQELAEFVASPCLLRTRTSARRTAGVRARSVVAGKSDSDCLRTSSSSVMRRPVLRALRAAKAALGHGRNFSPEASC